MANMIFRRGTRTEINNVPVQDGQLLFDTTNREILMDNGSQRQRYGGNVTIDDELSDTSENPVQNKVINGALDDKLAPDDVIDDLSTAVAVTENGVPVGCKAVAELNENLNALSTRTSNSFGTEVAIPIGSNYTCPSDGMVIFGGYDSNYIRCKVNSIVVGSAGNNTTISLTSSWRVNKNDIIRMDFLYGSDTSKIAHHFRPCV